MKHQLPHIENLIQTNYYLIDQTDLNSPYATELIKKAALSPDAPLFYLKDTELFFLPSTLHLTTHVPFSDLPWEKTQSAWQSQTLSEIIELLTVNRMILIKDKWGKPLGYIDAAVALREVHRSYNHLKAFFDTMIQTMDASITVIDEAANTVVWTSGAEAIFSIKQADILGKPIFDFFPMEMLQCMKTLETGESVYRKQHQPREDVFVLINTSPIRLHGKIIGAVVAETDITSQVRLNQELFNATSRVHHLQQEIAKLSPSRDPFCTIKGTSPAIRKTVEMVKKIGSTKATTLILGESGVGKELFAKALHDIREQPDAPFIAINCGAIPATLFESELFGYEKGAFSGADQKGKKGKIELAREGTLFLDEVGELPLDMQVKLLRVLQEKKYFAVGGTKQVEADFRVIAATNVDLEELVRKGEFREDFYYRLNVVTITIPPLRERTEDIIELTHYFLYEFSVRYNRLIKEVPQTIMQDLLDYHWPGNIRELRNVIERLVVFATDGIIKREDLPFATRAPKETVHLPAKQHTVSLSLQEALDLHEKDVILTTLELEQGNKMAAAKRLGISRATLYNRMSRLQIPVN